MEFEQLKQVNIDNLTGLWKKMGFKTQPANSIDPFNASLSWPYRYWLDWDSAITNKSALNDCLSQLPASSIVPVWHVSPASPIATAQAKSTDSLEQSLLDNGFSRSFEQTAMVLNLEQDNWEQCPSQAATSTEIKIISSQPEIKTWTDITQQAFGYEIDLRVIQKVAAEPDIQLLVSYDNGQAAAVAMLYRTGDIVGVHQVGVAEKYRGKGIARTLMLKIIEMCRISQVKYITLQASAAGKPLYDGLGFEQQFSIRNYKQFELT